MTTTLTEDTTYSTLMIMSYDTIDLAGYVLTIDSQPYESGDCNHLAGNCWKRNIVRRV
jgi:hypothetical protein